MKNSMASLLLFLVFLIPLFGQTSPMDRPVAVVKLHKTEVLPQTKFVRYKQAMMLQNGGKELSVEEKKQLLDVLINQMLVRQDAENRGIFVEEETVLPTAMQGLSLELQQAQRIPAGAVLTDPEQFKQLLVENGHDYDLYLENTKNSMLIENYVMQTKRDVFENMEMPSRSMIEDFYNQNISEFAQPEHIMIRQIFFSVQDKDKGAVRDEATALFNRIVSGKENFDDLVKNRGDNFPYTQIKGQPFTIAKSDAQADKLFGEAFTDSLFLDTTKEKISLKESDIGFHIVRVEEYNKARILGLDDPLSNLQDVTVFEYLNQLVTVQLQQKLYVELQQAVVLELREKAEINTFEDAL